MAVTRRRNVTRFRRKVVVAAGLAVVTVAAGIPLFASGSGAASDPSSNIDDYALFAVRTVQMKGQGSTVNGNVGAGTRHYMPGNIDEYALGKEFLNGRGQPASTG